MVEAENLFVGTERDFGEAQCFSRVTRGDQQAGKIATHAICVGMLGAKRLLVDRQRALEERPRRRISRPAPKIATRPAQKVGTLRAVGCVRGLALADRDQMRRERRTTWP